MLLQELQNLHKDILQFTRKSRTIHFCTILDSTQTHIYEVYAEHTRRHINHKGLKEFLEILLYLYTKWYHQSNCSGLNTTHINMRYNQTVMTILYYLHQDVI